MDEADLLNRLLDGESLPAEEVFDGLGVTRLYYFTRNFYSEDSDLVVEEGEKILRQEIGSAYRAKMSLEPRTVPGAIFARTRDFLENFIYVQGARDHRESLFRDFGDYEVSLYTDEEKFTGVYHAVKNPDDAVDIIESEEIQTSSPGVLREKLGVVPVVYTNRDPREARFYQEGDSVVFELEVHEDRLGYGAHSFTLADTLDIEKATVAYVQGESENFEQLLSSQDYDIEVRDWENFNP